jgi:dolichol-phosphate mannosyltransferase
MTNLVIIPVYNEEIHIGKVLKKVRENTDSDILVINDGSTDNSLKIVYSLISNSSLMRDEKGMPIHKINLITHTINQGYGKSLIDGFDFAITHGYQYMITMDCDEQHEPHLIPTFFSEIKEFDIVSGSRYLKEFPSNNPPPQNRKWINDQITEIINHITGYNITDSFCGFKAYRVSSLKKLRLTEYGYGMPLQLWIQAWNKNLTVKEYTVGRIYKNLDRSFGNELDNPERRLAYYKRIIEEELAQTNTDSLKTVQTVQTVQTV